MASATGAGRLSRPKDAARTRSDARDNLTGVSLAALACLGVLPFTRGEVGVVPARSSASDATGSVLVDTGIVFVEVRLAMTAIDEGEWVGLEPAQPL